MTSWGDVGADQVNDSGAAFGNLLETLREVGKRFAGEEWGLGDPTDIAEGLRVIVHHLGTGIETQLEQDAAHPTFREIVTPWRKALGDNADARYHDAVVHPPAPTGCGAPRAGPCTCR